MDISSINSLLFTIKSATDIVTIIKQSGSSLEEAEVKLKLAELISALADLKMEVANIRELLAEKDTEIQRLKQELQIKANVVWKRPFYCLESDGSKEEPYCQKCYDSLGKLIHLQTLENRAWKCNECNSIYRDRSSEPISNTMTRRAIT